jgi:4-amino-4-deoxy-L-arabinose transferase-like glycosyltransferase
LSRQLAAIPPAHAASPSIDGPFIYEAQHPPLYYWLMSLPLRMSSRRSIVVQAFNLRLLNVLLASSFVPLCFLLARRFWQDDALALSCAALAVAMPELLIHVSRITNDALGLVLFTGLLVLAVSFADDLANKRTALAGGAILGLGLLTKAYFLIALSALAVVAVLYRNKTRAGSMNAAAACSIIVGVAAAISSLWFWHNFKSTGAWSGLAEDVMLSESTLVARLSQFHRVDWMNASDSVFNSHVWFGAWSFLTVRSWMYHVFRVIALAGVVGILVVLVRGNETTPKFCKRSLGVLVIFYASFLAGLCYHVLEIFLARSESTSTGWYLYSVGAAEVILLSVGLRAIVGERF